MMMGTRSINGKYRTVYPSPIGTLLLTADDEGVTGLDFDAAHGVQTPSEGCAALFEAVKWLDIYFSGAKPDFTPPLHITGTVFGIRIAELMLEIPYGEVVTYGEIARRYAERFKKRTAPRAVGGAAGRNPIPVIIPCHRVVGAGGKLTGYTGGLDKKIALLAIEGCHSQPM